MAEQTDNSNPPPGGDEMIDLEGLVRNIDLTPTDSIAAKKEPLEAAAEPPPESSEPEESEEPEEPLHAEALDPAKFDEILNIEDPEMAAQVEALRAAGFKKDASGASIEDEAEVVKALNPLAKLSIRERIHFNLLKLGAISRSVRVFAIRLAKDSKGLLREMLAHAKLAVLTKIRNVRAALAEKSAWLKSRNSSQKLALVTSFVALGLLIFVGANTIQGTLLPNVERAWIASFADHADGKFSYQANGSFEDFNDPLLHPEFVILVERIVVNLKRTPEAPDSANPMAAFELYLQTDNQDAAVEIKDRSVEVRDAVARSVERMTYPDLADEDGKAKLKLLIRKDLNEIITRGKVRRVFFKTIVLNPE